MEAKNSYFPPHPGSQDTGISVRDKLAESAMIGLLSNTGMIDSIPATGMDWIADNAYKIADAMIIRSNKP